MKKFAKILGFLGFFVTLATAQIGTAYALRVECNPGYYIRRGETTCTTQCPSAGQYGEGVFCQGSPEGNPYEIPDTGAEDDIGIELCRYGKCNDGNNLWLLTPAGASSPSECKGTCKTSCIHPNSNCPLPNTNFCEYDRTEQVDGEIECFGSCTPENTPTNYCDVTCPKTCEARCICPLDESQTGSCPGYDTTEMVTGVLACGASTGSCDVKHNIYGNPTANNGYCQQTGSCTVKCEKGTCPTGTTCDWDLDSHPQSGHVSGDDCVDDLGNVISPQQCDMINVVCSDPCQYWDGKECKTYSSITTYKCGSNTVVAGPIDAICGMPYTINRTTDGGSTQIIDTSSCTPSGYRLQGWRLTIDYSPYDQQLFSDPEVPAYNRFNWQATTNNPATFEAQWEEDKLYVYYNRYGGAWVQSNPPVNDKEAFTISDLQPNGLTKYWTLTRDNSTFRGWCDDEYYGKDSAWMDAHCHSPYTIPADTTSDVYLYAWWECTGAYTLNSNYQCEGDQINVKYTCHAPENSSYNDTSYIYNNAATYGQEYKPVKSVEEVTAAPHSTACQFAGYEIDPQLGNSYQWILKNWNYSTGGKYSPGATMAANDWQHISPTPETEIEFELEPNVWKVKKYSVQYRCGSIDNYTFNAPGYVTDDGAIYNTNYIVANNNILSQFNELCAPADGYTLQNWTFACPGYENVPEGPYASGANFGTWTYDSNDCYFTANWAQTDFVIILDQNGGTGGNPSDYLYTRKSIGVYLDSARTLKMLPDHESNANPLTPPQKTINIALYPGGDGASFTYNGTTYPNGNVNYASFSPNLAFNGYYQNILSNPAKYIDPYEGKGYITNDGIAAGKTYDENYTVPQRTWVAHWGTYDLPLPSTATWNGHDFAGWKCIDAEGNTIYRWTPGNDSTPAVTGISGNITCTAQWSVACRSVSFDENGGTSTGGGNNGKFWKISGQIGWYSNSTCTSNATPNVENTRPTKEHATFIGYDDTVSAPTVRIFDNLGAITTGGENWTITQNATLYAQYECVAPYHLMDDGSCGSCPGGSFYNPSSTNPDHCDTCDQYLNAPSGTWDTRSPYNWSVKQCYRVCDGAGDTQQTCDVVNTVSNHSEMEQFLTGNLINGNTGKQISFYGNEFATSGAFNTCNSETGVTNCPQGFLANGASGANKLMAAAVDFYEDRDLDGTYEPNGKRYIVGGRSVTNGVYKLNSGFVWSQVVGDAQISDGEPIISIIYPATLAPTVADPEHHTFSNYGYPESDPSQHPFVDSNYGLTSGSDGNAKEIIDFANANNYSNMSPIIANSNYTRNLYAQYTAADSYTLTYLCNSGETPSTDHQVTGLYVGTQFNLITPNWCTGCYEFTGWWDGSQTITPDQFTNFTWNYNSDMNFIAQCDESTDKFIIYNKIPVSNVNADGTTANGNTYVHDTNGGTPTTFTCGDGNTNIDGQPQLKNSDDVVIGEVVKWCKDSDLEDCYLPLELQNSNCTDKNVYAKWECNAEAGYRLNDTGDDCVTCPAGSYLNNGNCEACPEGWTSNPPYNWTRNQCYKLCNGNNGTVDRSCNAEIPTTSGFYWSALFLNQDGTNHQITFYGNDINGTDVCKMEEITYCPAVLISFSAADSYVNKTKASQITFMKQGNNVEAGKRYIVGFLDANGDYVSINNSKFWSHIAGPGQQVTEGNNTYTRIIYPTDAAPSPDSTPNPAFKGYFTTTNGGMRYVTEALGLDSTNAVAFPQSPLSLNQIGDRTLYPQYCENGQEWNGSVCTGTDYTVKYICGAHGANVDGMSMENTATYGQSYKVAYQTPSNNQQIAACNPNTGYVLKTNDNKPVWKFNDNNNTEYFTGETIELWNFTIQSPTFTAQYDCDAGYTLSGTTCVLDSSNFHTITLDKNVGNLYGDDSDPTVLYTIEGDTTVYKNAERTEPFSRLDENPKKYARVTFHFCDGDDNSCEQPSTGNVTQNAYFTFDGFYVQYPDEYDRYISSDGSITTFGGQVASTYANDDRTWYAVWVGHGTVTSWPDNPTNPNSAYAFGGWWTSPNCNGAQMFANNTYDNNTELYACWSQNAFTVTYDCGIGTGGSAQDSEHTVSTNGTYNVLPNGTANGGVVNCNLDGQGFAGWKFSENTGVNTYNAGDTITWLAGYGDETLTAQYRTCNSNEVLVNGVCYPKCNDTTCTEPTPQNSQSHCPTNHTPQYPNNVTCSYAWEDISGYLDGGVCRYANGINQGQPINIGVCREMVVCNDSAYVWNSDPTVWACVPNTGITYNVQFKCNETDAAPISGYSFNVTYGQSITIPSNSDCPRTGYSYSQWKATQYDNPATLEAQNSTRTIDWNYTHNETFIADWNDGNVYHVNLHAYSCDDSTQTGTFGNSGVQELWEKYGVNWYRTNVGGTLSNPITELTTQQLPTRSGWTFGGYNTLGGDQRVRYANGAWNVSPTTLITEDEEWCAIWSQCNPNEYWNNGVCVTCNTATNGDFPLGDANATSIYQCYRQCSICTPVCPQTEGVNYCEYGNNPTMNGNLYYPGTGTCQPNYEQNCPITVLHCLPGYTPNSNNTACVPNNYMITLNSHIDGFNGHASSPEVLYTKYGPNGGAYLDSAYTYLMNDERSLYAVPVKSADVILNGNGGNVIWNGYSSSTATLTATFDFQGFYPSVYGGSQYIFDTGYISTNGNIAAQQNQSNSTVWHAQWQDGSITLPDAQRQCYTFGGWWTDMYNGGSAGNANMPYTPTGATTNLYAHWTPGTYSITYHNGNAIYSGCSTTSYTFGNAFNINCSITPQAGSHKVFNGWCTNPELTAGCTQNPVISNTDCGNKDYYAWWGCESGYNMENGVCVPNASELCPAQLPTNAYASLVDTPTISNNQCTYKIQCNSCIGENSAYDCYVYNNGNINSANTDGIFTITGPTNDNTVLNNVRCEPATYTAVYKCGAGTPTNPYYDTDHIITYNGSYTVLPNGSGGVVTCSKDGEMFNHWAFNLESGRQYNGGDPISPWLYHGTTVPIFTAQYGQCPAGEVYVPSLGQCKEECYVPCKVPTNGACPNDFDLTPTSTGVHAYCGTYGGQAPNPQGPGYYLYPAPHVNEACLHVHTGNEITPQQCTDVSVVYCVDSNGTRSQHYTWDWDMHQCKPRTYSVTLNSNNGIGGSNFVDKLYEQYNVGWSRYSDGEFNSTLTLSSSELPTARETCKVFDGYWNDVAVYRTISATGYLSLPATTLTDNTQVWNAHYVNDPNAYTITFQCSNGTVVSTQPGVVFNQGNVTAPVRSLCPGEAFTQWVSGNVTLNAGTIYPNWQYCSNMTFNPDVSNSSVWEVTLLPGDGTFDPNDIRKLYDAVNVGWYTNRDLSEQSRITQIDNDKVPTKQGANFVGYKNQNGVWRVNYPNGSGWDLPQTNDLSGHETWTAQYNLCQAGYYYQDGQCKLCPSGYTSDPTTATQPEHCYVQCETCVEPACPSIPHSTGCVFDHNNNENYPGYLFYSQYGQNKCVKRTFNYNFTETIMCNWCARCDEANGWIRDPDNCQVCVPSWQSNGHTIDLNSLRMTDFDGDPTGDDVEPVRLYTWPDRGVYLDSGRTSLMTVGANGNNPVRTPTTYGVVRFDPNGGTVDLDGYRYTNRYGDRYVYANFRGFYNSQTGSTQYIDNSGHITTNGDDWGHTAEYDVTWYAKWQYGTIGELPIPTRLGYTFTGWYDSISGGNPVYESTRVERSMPVYARWEKAKYFVNLDKNGGQWGSDPVYKLWESYGTGWSTEENGTFNPGLTLVESQRPSWPGNSKVFNGYWTARNNGTQQIRADGSVVDTTATVLTVDNTTWYAQYVDNTNKYTITFRCSENASPIRTYRVSGGESITVPAKSECLSLNPGYSFTKWMGNQGTNFNARDSEYTVIWESFSDADFVPNWNDGDVYHVTLLQNDADAPGEVRDLYEKYASWWALDQNNQYPMTSLSGDQLPTKTGYDFAGFKTRIGGYTRGDFDSESNVWVPQSNREITNDEEWVPKWTQCKPYWYYDNIQKICKECPAPYTNNEHPESLADCYDGRCERRCIERAIECPTDPNAIEFEYSNDVYSGTNYYQNHCVLDIWVQQGSEQEVIPSCECTIKTCKPGYHPVNGVCVAYAKTDIILNPNGGTWSSNVPSEYKYLYTIESTGVYRNSARTEEMTPTNGVALYAIPSNGASVTLDANDGTVTWGGGTGEVRTGTAAFGFNGFYNSETPGYASVYIEPQETNGETYAFITTGGQSAGMGYTTTLNTWYAQWNRSVTLPTPERQNYTFVGWTYNGELVSNPWTVPGNTTNITLIAQWTKNAGTIVTYNCNNEGGQGGTATDPTPAYIGETYTVLGNFIPCSKPATETTRAHEFENWQFNGGSYLPGYVFSPWSYTGSNPTFNAHYKECGDGYYFGSNGCQACPYGYPHSNIDATLPQHCYKNDCELPCVRVCPPVDAQEPGALACTYTMVNYTGTEYYEGSCNAAVQNCPWRVWCNEGAGYIPDANGEHCVRQDQYEITLDPNGGTGGQEKLYTIYNTGVYLDQARTRQMSAYNNYLTNLPQKNAVATFDCNPECSTPVSPVSVELVFNGYYERQSGGAKYINKFVDNGVAKGAITSDGNTAGKGYTANATWFAQWSGAAIGNSRWPENPTRPNACATYSFYGWWTAANGGNVVSPDTPVSENVTWYAHWCESCPTGTIDHGSCTPQNCKATFTCDDGYYWNADNCSCVLSPDTRFTLTYKPNGGTPIQPKTQSLAYGETFRTFGGDTFTKSGEVLCRWDEENHATTNTFPEAVAELSTEYTYLNEENITLLAHWAPCQCTQGAAGVQGCSFSVVNNACVPTVTCMPGYIPNGTPTCAGECNATCDTSTSCRICPAGTYQEGNECKPCSEGFTSNAGATSCYGKTITIDWDENGGNAISNGFCVYGQTLTLANAPEHSNRAMQFLGWKLFTGDSTYQAGTNVMCTYDNVGVYSGTSTKIQAQWNECKCNYSEEDHVQWCQPTYTSGICMCVATCMPGYELIDNTYTCNPECRAKTSNITYECGEGTGTPEYSTDSATFDANYIVKGRGTCQMTGFNFVGWKLSANSQTYQPGYRFEPWNFTQQNPTFTAQYSQCAAGEVWVNGACEPCTCPQENWGAGVTQCVASPLSPSTCSALVSCNSGYYHPQWNCNGATCSAQCDQIQSNAIYVCGDGATGPAPATETMNYGDIHTVKGQASCAKSGYTFNGWNFTGTNGNYNPGATVRWNYGTDQTFTGNWCENCGNVANGSCSLDATNAGQCSYTTSCYDGYVLVSGAGTAHPVCEPDDSLTITYQPNGGMNNGVLGQPVIQNVTYGAEFITKPGTIFTKENSIITAWDHVEGGDYPNLNYWYVYDTDIDTKLDAHWEQCTCTADNCTTYATDSNTCACSATCPTGYTYGGCNCNGTVCAPICNKKQSDAIYVCGEGTTGQAPAAQTMNYGDTHTVKDKGNCSKTNHTFMKWAFTGDGDYHNPGDTVAWYYTEDKTFTGQWCENCSDVANGSCELGTVFAGSCQYTCSCEPGYKLVGDCNAHPVCEPDNTLAIHYKSNNGLNQTYNQPVTYGQSFVTEGGTRFTYTNHVMTQWKVENDATTTTFPTGIAGLSGDYVYGDTTDTTLSAQWEQCTCDADNCSTYATNSNTCACNATCPTGYTYGGCECDGTVCEPICTLGGSNAIYKCGTGIGAGYSTYVNYGATHTILTHAFVGCYRDNSTFAGWTFNGDNNIYFDNVGATIPWDYTTDKEFEARWCSNCPVVEHGTNLLTIPEPGLCRCDLTCDTGYHVENGACEPNVYPNENGITYKPNGGTPNRNYTQSVTYDAPFTTLGVVYSKARHILNRWDVESGGAGTFNGGYAALGTEYTYHTDGATSLLAEWIECGINEISLDNRCQQCRCTDNNAGVTSCETSATNNDTCSCSGECAAGYINAGCNCNGTNCTQSCTKCADNQVSVNNACENCVCEKNIDGIEGIISGCGFVSNNGNTCNWDPTTCRLGYGYPDLTCTETEHNNNCTASCTICPAGTYGDNGIECKPCPEGKTSLAGATSIRECFIDPNSCAPDEHIEHGECTPNVRACSIPDATSAVRIWNPAIGTYGPCTVEVDGCNTGYHVSGNVCVKDTEACTVEHGHGERDWNGTSWGACGDVVCDPGYEPNSDYTACVECSNRRVNGEIAVSGYIYECEIAACMYQGQKYALQNGECVPICEDASDYTGTKVWDERTKKCIRTCKPGYKMW